MNEYFNDMFKSNIQKYSANTEKKYFKTKFN